MKIEIEVIHTGRYCISIHDGPKGFEVHDGGSALVMLIISDLIFKAEHQQYISDQRTSSGQLADETLKKMYDEATDPRDKLLIESRMKNKS